MALHVEVVSPAGEAWTGEATQVSVPLINGELGVLPGRQPLVAVLGTGPVRLSSVEVRCTGSRCPAGSVPWTTTSSRSPPTT